MGVTSRKIWRRPQYPKAILKNSSIEIAKYMPVSVVLDDADLPTFAHWRA
jgi:hypothetical protein